MAMLAGRERRMCLMLVASLVRACSGRLRFLTRSDTVYMQELPYHNLVELELTCEGDWNLRIAACHEGEQFQEIFNHNGHGPVAAFPFTLQWHQYSNIYINVTLSDESAGTGWVQQKKFAVKFLEPASYITANQEQGQRLHKLDTDDETVAELLTWAVDELSSTLRMTWDHVLQALLLSEFAVDDVCRSRGVEQIAADASASASAPGAGRHGGGYGSQGHCVSWAESLIDAAARQGTETSVVLYITVEAHLFEPGAAPGTGSTIYLLGIERRIGNAAAGTGAYNFAPTLIHAHKVPAVLWAGLQSLGELTQAGVCAEKEEQIDEDLGPWESTGGVITEEQVRDMASEAAWSRYCNRLLIVNNSLFIHWAHQDQAADSTANGKKWYTIALLETLTSVLARVRVPDVDLCVAEEGPQVLRGGNQPVLAATRSSAHMDVLVPDLFFRYWETPPHLVPHPWYKPPFNLASPRVYAHTDGGPQHDGDDVEVGLAWEQRTGKAFWRGSIDEWAMSARGRLCRLAARRPDLFDVEPIRITGRALHSWSHFPAEEMERFESAIRRGGQGVETDPGEVLKFKYVINIHGNGNEWSNRFRMLLSSGALVFKQQSTLFECWERHFRAYEHYIPVKADLSDLVEQVEWARANDEAARHIARAAVALVRQHLHLDAVQCYWARLIHRYSALQDFKPAVPAEAVPVVNLASSLWRTS